MPPRARVDLLVPEEGRNGEEALEPERVRAGGPQNIEVEHVVGGVVGHEEVGQSNNDIARHHQLTRVARQDIEVAGEPAQSGGPVDVVRPVRLDDDGAGRNPRERRRVKRRFVDPL